MNIDINKPASFMRDMADAVQSGESALEQFDVRLVAGKYEITIVGWLPQPPKIVDRTVDEPPPLTAKQIAYIRKLFKGGYFPMKKPWNYIDPPRSRLPDGFEPADRSRRIGFVIAIVLAVAIYVMWTR